MVNADFSVNVRNDVIELVAVVRDLDVLLESEPSMKRLVTKVASRGYFHLCRWKPIRCILGRQLTTCQHIYQLDY